MVDTEDSKSSAPKACGFESRPGYHRPESKLTPKSRPGRVLLHALSAEMIPAGFPKLPSVKRHLGLAHPAESRRARKVPRRYGGPRLAMGGSRQLSPVLPAESEMAKSCGQGYSQGNQGCLMVVR